MSDSLIEILFNIIIQFANIQTTIFEIFNKIMQRIEKVFSCKQCQLVDVIFFINISQLNENIFNILLNL